MLCIFGFPDCMYHKLQKERYTVPGNAGRVFFVQLASFQTIKFNCQNKKKIREVNDSKRVQ